MVLSISTHSKVRQASFFFFLLVLIKCSLNVQSIDFNDSIRTLQCTSYPLLLFFSLRAYSPQSNFFLGIFIYSSLHHCEIEKTFFFRLLLISTLERGYNSNPTCFLLTLHIYFKLVTTKFNNWGGYSIYRTSYSIYFGIVNIEGRSYKACH